MEKITEQAESACWQAYFDRPGVPTRNRLFTLYSPWGEAEAYKLYGQLDIVGSDPQDFIQWSHQAILESIERFDPAREIPFKSFAIYRIRGAILSALAKLTEVTAFYSQQGKLIQNLSEPEVMVEGEESNDPLALLISMVKRLSLEYLLLDPDNRLNQLTGEFYSSPEISAMSMRVQEHLEELPEPSKTVMKQYYFEGMTFDAIARHQQLSNGRVSQLHKNALSQLSKRAGW